MNTDSVVQNPKQVTGKNVELIFGELFQFMKALIFFFSYVGYKGEYFKSNYKWNPNDQARKGSPCCICFDH